MSAVELNSMQPWGNGPAIVPYFKQPPGGVDYLGLRQVNLDMMAMCLPGITNATSHIRPFTVLCWIHWKFHQLLEDAGRKRVTLHEQRKYQDKVETLFTWGHQLERMSGIPGTNSACPSAEPGGWVDLSFGSWGRQAANTSLQAAVQYGPAMKTSYGFGFIEPIEGGFFHVTPNGKVMAECLDAELKRRPSYGLITDLSRDRGRAADAAALWPAWRVDRSTADEQKQFRSVFFDEAKSNENTNIGRRSATLSAVMAILRSANKGLTENEIRRSLAWRRVPGGASVSVDDTQVRSCRHWLSLQVRQAQRAALEWLLSWLERKLVSNVNDVLSLREEVYRELEGEIYSEGGRATGEDTMKRFRKGFTSLENYLAKSSEGSNRCFFELLYELMNSDECSTTEILHKVVGVHFATLAITDWMQADPAFHEDLARGEDARRISLGHQLSRWRKFADREVKAWIADILERWVLSQHLSVATYRYNGGTQRLRFSFDEKGLEFYADKPFRPIISQDHLASALSLSSEAKIIDWNENTERFELR